MATALSTVITSYPGQYLATLTNANTGYAFTYPVGVPLRITIQPHVNSASVSFIEDAISDGVTAVTPGDHMIVPPGSTTAGSALSWLVAPEAEVKLTRATQFVLSTANAGTKVLIVIEEVEG